MVSWGAGGKGLFVLLHSEPARNLAWIKTHQEVSIAVSPKAQLRSSCYRPARLLAQRRARCSSSVPSSNKHHRHECQPNQEDRHKLINACHQCLPPTSSMTDRCRPSALTYYSRHPRSCVAFNHDRTAVLVRFVVDAADCEHHVEQRLPTHIHRPSRPQNHPIHQV